MRQPSKPEVLRGGKATDDRGSVSFINDFSFCNVRRFYTIRNHTSHFVRAWHGHQVEGKYFTVLSGAAIIGAVPLTAPAGDTGQVNRWVISADYPAIVWIPPGYANGTMNLTPDTIIVVYSTTSLEDSLNDDLRLPSRQWDIWNIEER